MGKSKTLNLGTGAFVILGFAALFFLTTQVTSRGLSFGSTPHYDVTAKFDNIGDLRVGAPVSMSGVEIGRVVGLNASLKNGCRRVSNYIVAAQKACPQLIDHYQQMDGRQRMFK